MACTVEYAIPEFYFVADLEVLKVMKIPREDKTSACYTQFLLGWV